MILYTDNGSVKVKNYKGQSITTVDSKGKSITKSYTALTSSTSSTIKSSSSSTSVTLPAGLSTTTTKSRAVLIGDSKNNTLRAGKVKTQLWGGTGGNDTLIGGSNDDVFWYGKNDGNDVIKNLDDDDLVKLYDINLSDITSITDRNNKMTLRISGGGTLTINYTDDESEFQFSNCSKFEYDHKKKRWECDD